MRIYTDRRWVDDTRIEIVRLKHSPSKLDISVEDTSQLKAYNIAIKMLEEKVLNHCRKDDVKMKVYIAGKITGLEDYKDKFNVAEGKLKNSGYICMNPSVLPEGFPWEIYMPICYAMIDACNCIYLLKNWVDSKGAKLEHEYAKSKNKRIMYEP